VQKVTLTSDLTAVGRTRVIDSGTLGGSKDCTAVAPELLCKRHTVMGVLLSCFLER
jgi:hypothetical protein